MSPEFIQLLKQEIEVLGQLVQACEEADLTISAHKFKVQKQAAEQNLRDHEVRQREQG